MIVVSIILCLQTMDLKIFIINKKHKYSIFFLIFVHFLQYLSSRGHLLAFSYTKAMAEDQLHLPDHV